MRPSELIQILSFAERLKCNTRHAYTSSGRHESVAEHSWRTALMAMLCSDEFPDADMDKVIRMCLIHDLGEAFTGDIPCFEKDSCDEKLEEKLLMDWAKSLPKPYCDELTALYEEMFALQTQEAKIYKALDNMEAVIQHNESDISTWLPLEYDLQLTYGEENVKFSSYMQALKAQANEDTREKIRNSRAGEKA